MTTLSQQVSAVEAARRVILGSSKLPKAGSSEAKLLAEQLASAVENLRRNGAAQ